MGVIFRPLFIGAMHSIATSLKVRALLCSTLSFFFCLPDRRHSLAAYALRHDVLGIRQCYFRVNPKCQHLLLAA